MPYTTKKTTIEHMSKLSIVEVAIDTKLHWVITYQDALIYHVFMDV